MPFSPDRINAEIGRHPNAIILVSDRPDLRRSLHLNHAQEDRLTRALSLWEENGGIFKFSRKHARGICSTPQGRDRLVQGVESVTTYILNEPHSDIPLATSS